MCTFIQKMTVKNVCIIVYYIVFEMRNKIYNGKKQKN